MSDSYDVPAHTLEHELVIKQSRFIACTKRVSSREQWNQWLAEVKQKWPGANHYCTAAIFGAPNDGQSYVSSDDGEPSGTAGRPMLNVLLHQAIGEIGVVVVRYFGGIKLGTGGLQRAYGKAVSESLQQLQRRTVVARQAVAIHFDYSDQGVVERLLAEYDVQQLHRNFAASVQLVVAVAADQRQQLAQQLADASQGRVQLKEHRAGLE
ncbi:YigZ family protein [Idiomarina tyrosinivorans]|uniref:YigZ family protein n=1 Tax=Idiomarina tyrosinivorans TaxID=1445662 RepID=A0A432ZT00_9GAMM|nr:YigZ family protein [Idiomarina tyrosinivorans]RUO81040.1 YigZ family protein [Idiomarina tyrosinivorans]